MTGLKKKAAVGFAAAVLAVMQTLPVCAAGTAKVYLEPLTSQEGTVTVECHIDGDQPVTNGKFRIQYDPEELQLQKTELRETLSGTMAVINDCIQGNKADGEAVVVFANASPIEADGTMFEMTFRTGDAFDSETGSEIRLAVEELDAESGAVDVETADIVVTGESQQGGQEAPPEAEAPDDGSEAPDESTSVQTGDLRNPAVPAAACAAALAAAAGIAVAKKKSGKK